MKEEDFSAFTIYAQSEEFTLYINDMTDIMNSFLQSREDLRQYKVLVARRNGTMQSAYAVIDADNRPVFIDQIMENVETFINYELGGCTDGKMSYMPNIPKDNNDSE